MASRISLTFTLVVLFTQAAAASGGKRPPVDVQAMREAMGSPAESESRFASAASYAHYLSARLLHLQGDHRRALDELRLALASDDGNAFLMVQLAEQYARLSDLDRAEASLKKVIEKQPNYVPAQLLMGRVLYEGQRYTRARVHLHKAIKLKPRDVEGYLVLTQLHLDQGQVDDAVKVIEELGAALPGEPVGFKRLGMALAERGDTAKAEKLLLRAVDRDPGDFDSWVTLGQLYESTARLAKGEEAYSHALEREPENREVLLAAGRLALRQEAPVRAKAYFDQLLSLSKDPELAVKVAFSYLAMRQLGSAADVLDATRKYAAEPRLHFYAGLVHERMRSYAKAADAFAGIGRESGDLYNEALLHRANCLSSLGQHRGAIEMFKKALEERPEAVAVIVGYARALERSARNKEAEGLLAKSLARQPLSEIFEALAAHYEREGRLAEAIDLLTTALAKKPKDEVLLYALGSIYDRKGDIEQSLQKMRTLLDINPEHANAMNFIGYILADKGIDIVEAERLLTRALEIKPDNGSFLDSLGWVYFRKGDMERAVTALEKASSLAPGEPTIIEHLGDAYSKLSRRHEAESAYKRALEALKGTPDAPDAKQQRTGLERKLKGLGAAEASR
jgi:tetratricopeptide (TPR) repeat protein